MRFYIFLVLVLLSSPLRAEDTIAVDVPQISFSQQVNIVVTAKRDPRLLEMKIRQEKDTVFLDLILDQNQDREEAKTIAQTAIIITKSYSLDDKPVSATEAGKGLYTYTVTAARPDGVVLVTAHKKKDEAAIQFENPAPSLAPLTRAGVNGQ